MKFKPPDLCMLASQMLLLQRNTNRRKIMYPTRGLKPQPLTYGQNALSTELIRLGNIPANSKYNISHCYTSFLGRTRISRHSNLTTILSSKY